MLALYLAIALAGLLVVACSLAAALVLMLGREADLVIENERLKQQLDGVQDESNDRAARLSRRKNPGIVRVPSQRKASA